jgi:hypothetical protein
VPKSEHPYPTLPGPAASTQGFGPNTPVVRERRSTGWIQERLTPNTLGSQPPLVCVRKFLTNIDRRGRQSIEASAALPDDQVETAVGASVGWVDHESRRKA